VRSDYRRLVAYRVSSALSIALHQAVSEWPSFERWSIGLQLVRAADSIAANIAEHAGREHNPDRRRLLLIARGSLYETEHWLRLALECDLQLPAVNDQMAEIARTLTGLIKHHEP
jgi:four helix bundle protein